MTELPQRRSQPNHESAKGSEEKTFENKHHALQTHLGVSLEPPDGSGTSDAVLKLFSRQQEVRPSRVPLDAVQSQGLELLQLPEAPRQFLKHTNPRPIFSYSYVEVC